MDVKLRPAMNGCLIALFAVMTLGLVPLLIRMGERHFIRRMDEAGFETRGGKRVAWGDLTGIRRVVGTMQGVQLSSEIILHSKWGKASLMLSRCGNAQDAEAYLLRRVPRSLGAG